MLSAGLSIALLNTASVNAQSSSNDSYLPPEVIPVSQNYNSSFAGSPISNNSSINSINNFSAFSQRGPQAYQTPQESRKALYDMLLQAGTPTRQNNNPINNGSVDTNNVPNQNIASNQGQIAPQNVQTLGSPVNTVANNYQTSPSIPQAQTLSGPSAFQSTAQQPNSRGIAGIYGMGSALSSSFFNLGSAGAGNIYSTGYYGGALANYGLRNGFMF